MKREVKWRVDRKWGIRCFDCRCFEAIYGDCHFVKVFGTDHRKEVEVGGVPIKGRHKSMSLNEGRESRVWLFFYRGTVP